MATQKISIMGALEETIRSLKDMREVLLNPSNSDNEIHWSLGGLIVSLTHAMHKLSCEVILKSAQEHQVTTAKDDIEEIRTRFNHYIDRMLDNE